VRNVLNTLRVLEEVAARQPIGVGELARVLDLPKSSVQRALVTLNTAGWIRQASGEVTRWVMTTKALAVGGRASGDLGLRDAAVPIMEDLRRRTEETIHLTVPQERSVVLIERLETSKPVRISMSLGHALPLHASANGKAVLANSGSEVIGRLLADELPRYTDTTITDPDARRAGRDPDTEVRRQPRRVEVGRRLGRGGRHGRPGEADRQPQRQHPDDPPDRRIRSGLRLGGQRGGETPRRPPRISVRIGIVRRRWRSARMRKRWAALMGRPPPLGWGGTGGGASREPGVQPTC
jgi:IclR family transcriptional regulator, acetate operon repressor